MSLQGQLRLGQVDPAILSNISNCQGRGATPSLVWLKEKGLKSGHIDLNPGLFLINYVTLGKSFNLTGFMFSLLED